MNVGLATKMHFVDQIGVLALIRLQQVWPPLLVGYATRFQTLLPIYFDSFVVFDVCSLFTLQCCLYSH